MGRMLVKLLDATSGVVRYDGKDISRIKNRAEELRFRREAQMIFQDPYASLDPRKKVLDIVAEGIDIHHAAPSRDERDALVFSLLESVGLKKTDGAKYAHEFSGGQRQRIGIARSLALNPRFVVCDEPISALDVSIQAQIVNLLVDLQKEKRLTYLFIAHDLSMVKFISDRIAVMFGGSIVELGRSDAVYNDPIHPYTKSLISAIPHPDPDSERTRKRIAYTPPENPAPRALREIRAGHFALCDEDGRC